MNKNRRFRETIRETFMGKFKLFALICALFGLNLPNFAQSCLPKKTNILVQNVEVLVDNIFEEGLSLQISGLAKNAFSKVCDDGKSYSIKINLRERSFYKNVDNVHSLYASYQLFSEDGECVLENVFCSESKKSILSALVQQKQIAKIAKDLKKYFESENKADA